jgi:shikimate dehydrogenase
MISGATRLLVIVGDPIAQVRSPLAYNERLSHAGHDVILVPWHTPIDKFDVVMAGLMSTMNVAGIIVTYPFKQRAYGLVPTVGLMAQHVGAVNALRREPDGRWAGDMFDGIGLIRAVASIKQGIAGRRVKLLGAGGAGSAIAFALAEAQAKSLSIYDTDVDRASKLAVDIAGVYPDCRVGYGEPSLGDAELLINATPVGLKLDDGLPVPLPALSATTSVVDIVPRQGGTPLLAYARARGCPNLDGNAMVAGQVAAVLEFFGLPADVDLV